MAVEVSSKPHLHILLFPFMSKGHTIPLLQLAKLIHKHRPHAKFTIFTTPSNKPFISNYLSTPTTTYTIITLPSLTTNDDDIIPKGVESTDQLPSISLFYSFVKLTEQLKPSFEIELETCQTSSRSNPISFAICDGFLYWTQECTTKFNIPRLTFYGMNVFAPTLCRVMFGNNHLFEGVESDDELIPIPEFPWLKVSKNHFDTPFRVKDVLHPSTEFMAKCGAAFAASVGLVVNTFDVLEKPFIEYSNSRSDYKKTYIVGPVCLADELLSSKVIIENKNNLLWMNWLNEKRNEGKSVLYIAFGSQAEISSEQLKEIVIGLEESKIEFLWALRIKPSQEEVMEGFEERVKERGMVVRGWVEQREILEHECVRGFLSHCGWNSTIESICAGVPILAWPMMAEQHLNAKMVVDQIKVGLEVETCDGSVRGFVRWEGLCKMVQELMQGEGGIVARKNVKEFSEVARKAILEGGSSWSNLESLLNEFETS